MAAKQQGRKKTRDVKKKKAQKKHQQVRRKQRKWQAQKQKKRQSCLKDKGNQSASEQETKLCSPRLLVSKILRQMPKVRMEAKARNLVKTMLMDVYNHVASEVETLSQKNEASAISGSDVQTALKEAMTKELAKHMAEQPTEQPSECA